MKAEHIVFGVAILLFIGSVFYSAFAKINNPIQLQGIATTTPWNGSDFAIELSRLDTAFVVADAGTSSPLFILNAKARAGFGTTTPSKPFSIDATETIIGSSGTTTFIIDSSSTTQGGCIELADALGVIYRLYITKGSTTLLGVEQGTCG